jgi:hypothetical protein
VPKNHHGIHTRHDHIASEEHLERINQGISDGTTVKAHQYDDASVEVPLTNEL